MISFSSDYMEVAHPAILTRLAQINREKNPGYGSDGYCQAAADKIRKATGCPRAEVFFLVGGTQTNQVIIDTVLAPYEGVVAACTGHVSAHEAGAVEFTGHKVMTLPHRQGKMDAGDLSALLAAFYADDNHEHMVYPGMVYISHPTEYGTLYTKAELTALSEVCRTYHIPLFLDGARLGYGLMSDGTDVTLRDVAQLCDVFYIGGTKVGAMFGEAVVFTRENMPKHFLTRVKQHGALLAKGWLLGVQFDTLFTDELYFRIARNAVVQANRLRAMFREKGYELYMENPTNQVFVVLDNQQMRALSEKVDFGFWEKLDDRRTVVRFATSWATTDEEVAALAALI